MLNLKNIFKKLKNEKTIYKSCPWAEHGINFNFNYIENCSMGFQKGGRPPILMKYNGQDFDFTKIFKIKEKIRRHNRSGKVYQSCEGCLNLIEKEWNKENYIDHLNFDNITKCHSNCIYCHTSLNKKFYNEFKHYKVLPTVKYLLENNLLRPGGEIMFGGGEPTLSEEFEELVNLLLDRGFINFKVHSTGALYSKAIERALKEDKMELIVSPDAGTYEMYKKIKRTEFFDIVWENLAKYASVQGNNKTQVKAKYIIIPFINNDKEHVLDFYKKVEEMNIKSIRIEIAVGWYRKFRNDKKALLPFFRFLKFTQDEAKKLNILEFHFQSQAQTAINEHPDLYNLVWNNQNN